MPVNVGCNKAVASCSRLALMFGAGLLVMSQNLWAAPPVANNDGRTMLEGSSITVNVLANDSDADGDVLSVTSVSSAGNGTTTLNSDSSIRYTPTPGFTGTDSFTYTMTDGNESATATVSIQVSEVRLEPLGDGANAGSIGAAIDDLCPRLGMMTGAELGAGGAALLQRCEALYELARTNPQAVDNVLRQVAPEEVAAQVRQASEFFRTQIGAVTQRQNFLAHGFSGSTFNGYAVGPVVTGGGAAGDEASPWSRLNFFASALNGDSEREQTLLEAGYESNIRGLTLGADYRVQDNLFLGLAGGWTQSELDFQDQGGSTETDITSLISYAVWYQGPFSVDLQLGYSNSDYDTERRIRYTTPAGAFDATAQGETGGSQWTASLQGQWDYDFQGFAVRPYGRIDYLSTDIDGYGENNANGWEIEISDQTLQQMTLELGAQFSYAWSQSWGVLLPQAQVSALSETLSSRDNVFGRFAFDPDPTNRFQIEANEKESLFYMLNVGVVAVMPHGFSSYLQYRQMLGYSDLEASQITLGLRYEL